MKDINFHNENIQNIIKSHFYTEFNLDFNLSIIFENLKKRYTTFNHAFLPTKKELFEIQKNVLDLFISQNSSKFSHVEEIIVILNKMTISNGERFTESKLSTPILSHDQSNTTLENKEKDVEIVEREIKKEVGIVEREIKKDVGILEREIKKDVGILEREIKKDIGIITEENLHFFSNNCNNFKNYKYIFTNFSLQNTRHFKMVYFQIFNNLYNINEHNNKLQITELKQQKKTIILPIGFYNALEFVKILEECLGENYDVTFNNYKNRINIKCLNIFNLSFIQNKNDNDSFKLKYILGFSLDTLVNNNNYTSDLDCHFNIFDTIYMKITTNDNGHNTPFDKYKSVHDNFTYFQMFNVKNFSKWNQFIFQNRIQTTNLQEINYLNVEFYINNPFFNSFHKIEQKINFNFILDSMSP